MASDYHELEVRLDHLLESTEDIRAQIKEENAKRDVANRNNEMRMRTNRFTARIAIVVAVIGLVIGYVGVHTGRDASHAAAAARVANVKTNQILASTRKGSCEAQVVSALKANKGQKDDIRVLVHALISASGKPITPQSQARVNAFYSTYDGTVDRDNPPRDCTPRGIACFLKIAPPVGSEPCGKYDGYLKV